MKRLSLLIATISLLILFAVSTSRGDGPLIDEEGDSPSAVDNATEPITGAAVTPQKGSEQPMKDPFTPYDIGGPEAAWTYQDLTDEEKAVVDHERADDQTAVQAAYADIAAEVADNAKAHAAAIAIGASDLAEGAVP